MVTPGLVEEKFESRFHHPLTCSNQLNITFSTTDNQSIVTENRIYKIMEFPLKDKKRGKHQKSKFNHRVRYGCVLLYFVSNRGPFFIDLIKVRGFHFTPALHTRLGLGLACLKNSRK